MSNFSRYLHAPVISYGQKSLSSSEKTISRNPDFIYPGEKIEAKFYDGYDHWFDFSRILLPTHFCYEQENQRSALEVGLCPSLIPAVPVAQSPSCYTRKRSRDIRDEQENHSFDTETDDKHPRDGEKVKSDENKEKEKEKEKEESSPKRKIILKLIQDKGNTRETEEWKSDIDKDSKQDFPSISAEANKDDQNQVEKSQYKDDGKIRKTKLEEYLEKRRKNNASAKKSREARRMRELQTQIHAAYLEDENSKLRTIVGALRKENTHLRDLLIV